LEAYRARDLSAITDLKVFAPHPYIPKDGKKADEVLKAVLRKLNVNKLYTDATFRLRGIKVIKSDFLTKLRETKDDYELKLMRYGARLVARVAETIDARGLIRAGRTELEVAHDLEMMLRAEGAHVTAFPTIVAAGKHSAYSHHTVTTRKLRNGDVVICDFGVSYRGYASDITRTFFVGKVPKLFYELYEVVAEAQKSAIDAVNIGVELKAVDEAARNVIKEYGYAEYYVHSTGHGIGLDVHESPEGIKVDTKGKVCAGNVFTIEPGIYIYNKGGIRFEDEIFVSDKGRVEILTRS
jgi:Xaa-Pro aminopeptidase